MSPYVLTRPFFSYWITFVHLVTTILAVTIYGIAPVGFSQHETVNSVSTFHIIYLAYILASLDSIHAISYIFRFSGTGAFMKMSNLCSSKTSGLVRAR